MKKLLWILLQLTWCLPQNLAGAVIWLFVRRSGSQRFRGAVVTPWGLNSCASVGCFIFMQSTAVRNHPLLVHEYGHTIQSAALGWLYLPVIVLPSVIWFLLPACKRYRRNKHISYYSFYTECWANRWGEKVSGEKSMGKAMID